MENCERRLASIICPSLHTLLSKMTDIVRQMSKGMNLNSRLTVLRLRFNKLSLTELCKK